MTEIRFLETHGEVFFAGKNFGKKFLVKSIPGLKLQWDEQKRRVVVNWKDRIGWIFEGNCAFLEPEEGIAPVTPINEHRTENVEGRRRAQVSTPTGHVFEGEGAGKTGKSKQ